MLNKNEKKQIINRLNTMFNSKEQLIALCNVLSNDIDKIMQVISKIIKYSFVKGYLHDGETLCSLIYHPDYVDEKYKEYLNINSKKTLFRFFNRKKDKEYNFSISLDEDINLTDLSGLIIPQKSQLQMICNNNLNEQKQKEEIEQRKNNYYKKNRIFEEIGFLYSRYELIEIDTSFIYYHNDLSGNINDDFNDLYNGERYISNPLSPLNNSYQDNIEQIKTQHDIVLRKIGNVYEIENGRHRIIYILKKGQKTTIPVKIFRRIEDREFNVIINKLKKEYSVKVYKNNLLDNNPNIIIVHNGIAYEIKNSEKLKEFYNNLSRGIPNNTFNHMLFNIQQGNNSKEIINIYKKIIIQKYLELGDNFLKNNFSNIIKHFENVDSFLLYKAFVSIQNEYQESKVYKYNFRDYCLTTNGYESNFNEKKNTSKNTIKR